MINQTEKTKINELVTNAKTDQSALNEVFRIFKPLVKSRAREFFILGATEEDVLQEGMIGLFNAIMHFDKGKNVAFGAFANLCVTRQIYTAVKNASRDKHKPLNDYISIYQSLYEDDDEGLIGSIPQSQEQEPIELLLKEEERRDFFLKAESSFSELEKEILAYYLKGESYSNISKQLNISGKSVDNALQRIKRKLSEENL